MSFTFLVISITWLALTLNAFRPLGSLLRLPSFFASWLVGELPVHMLLGHVATLWIFADWGAYRTALGRAAMLLVIVSGAGVALLWHRATRAEHIMRETLGSLCGDEAWPRVPMRHLMLPFSPSRRGVRRVRNVEFARVGKQRLLLDVYLPPGHGTRRPGLLQIHGGAWIIGDKREQGLPLLNHVAANGWVGFNANYRLSPRATFPDHLVDVKRAIAWIREHAEEYGVDPDFICVTGGSAGGHLSALAALTANDPSYQPGFECADTRVQGAVPFYGIYCFSDRLGIHPREFVQVLLERIVMKARLAEEPDKFRAASPLDRIHAEAPPMLVVHGNRDTLAPVEYARHFVSELRKVSASPVLHAEIDGAQHAFDVFASPRTLRVVEGVERFLSMLHKRHLAAISRRDAA